VLELLTDDEYFKLQIVLAHRPDAGSIIRWAGSGRGKRGGLRVIYDWAVVREQMLMLLLYTKNEQDDLSPDQLKVLKMIVEAEYL